MYQSATLSVATVAGDKEGGINASFPAPCASGHRGGTVITLDARLDQTASQVVFLLRKLTFAETVLADSGCGACGLV